MTAGTPVSGASTVPLFIAPDLASRHRQVTLRPQLRLRLQGRHTALQIGIVVKGLLQVGHQLWQFGLGRDVLASN